MCGLLSRNTIIGFALFLSLPLFGFGCGNFEDALGAGADKSGSIFNVEYIDPVYFEDSTRQVDVFMNPNCGTDEDEPDPEPWSDHFADVTFTNRPLNNSIEQTASTIYLTEYLVSYEPLTQGSPDLPSRLVRPIRESGGIEPCDPGSQCAGETLGQIEFVPVSQKFVLQPYVFTLGQLEYNIYYRFFGVNDYGYEVSADGATNFLAADYDNCGG
jgi:hypothetical protein